MAESPNESTATARAPLALCAAIAAVAIAGGFLMFRSVPADAVAL